MRLTESDLLRGARLVRPLAKYIDDVHKFSMYLRPKVPAILLADITEEQQSKFAIMGMGWSKKQKITPPEKPGSETQEAKRL